MICSVLHSELQNFHRIKYRFGKPSQIQDSSNVTPKHRNNGGGEDSSSRSLSFGRSGAAPKRRGDAFPVPADGEESADAAAAAAVAADGARLLLLRQRRLGSRTAARSYDALDDGEAASAEATAIGPLFSRRLGTARATYSPKPSKLNYNDNDNKQSPDNSSSSSPSEGDRHSKNPSSVLYRGRDFTSERSKSDLCHAVSGGGGALRDLVYRSSIRIMVRPEREILVIQRSASENRVSNGSGGGGGGGVGVEGEDEVSANGANADVVVVGGKKKKSRKESIGLIQKSVAKDNVR